MPDMNIFGNKSLSQLLETSIDCINEHKHFIDMYYILSDHFQESLNHSNTTKEVKNAHFS